MIALVCGVAPLHEDGLRYDHAVHKDRVESAPDRLSVCSVLGAGATEHVKFIHRLRPRLPGEGCMQRAAGSLSLAPIGTLT